MASKSPNRQIKTVTKISRYTVFKYQFVASALRVLTHEGNLVNGQVRDNARAKGECIIHPRMLTRLPECMH